MPVLDYKRKDQEGRHRLLAAKKAGVVRVPVLIVEEVTEPTQGLEAYSDPKHGNPEPTREPWQMTKRGFAELSRADYIKRLGKTPEEHAREIVAKEKTRGNVVEYRTVLESLTSTKY
ncbi:unnamed protein product, partial [marine sediment metagenome]